MQKERLPPRPAPEPAERDDIVVATGPRCPYCHDAIARSEPAKLACNACMAWHHQACWDAHGECSACGSHETGRADRLGQDPNATTRRTSLGESALRAVRTPPENERTWALFLGAFALVTAMIAFGMMTGAFQERQWGGAPSRMFRELALSGLCWAVAVGMLVWARHLWKRSPAHRK